MPLFTLGHSVLTDREFVQAARGIDVIADVRSHPGSKHVPHFSKLEMQEWLPRYGLQYEWWPQLGGWTGRHHNLVGVMASHGVDVLAYCQKKFPKQRIAAARKGGRRPCWENQGLYDFSWYMTILEFLEGMDALVAKYGGRDQPRAAMVCAEAQWWRCHRSMLADYLSFLGIPCYHLPTRPPKHEAKPRFQVHDAVIGARLKRYEPEVRSIWDAWFSGNLQGGVTTPTPARAAK